MTKTPPQKRADTGAPKKRGRPKGSLNKPKEHGRVVAVGVDAPRLYETERGPGVGRPEGYHPSFAEVARAMCRLGATDFDLAQEFGVKTQTVWNWRCKYPEFFDATMEGKEAFDNRIERSLAMRAAGYSYHSEKVFQFEGQIVRAQTVEHVAPDVQACRLWLMNRRPDQWRDKSEVKLDGSEAFLKLWQAIGSGAIGK